MQGYIGNDVMEWADRRNIDRSTPLEFAMTALFVFGLILAVVAQATIIYFRVDDSIQFLDRFRGPWSAGAAFAIFIIHLAKSRDRQEEYALVGLGLGLFAIAFVVTSLMAGSEWSHLDTTWIMCMSLAFPTIAIDLRAWATGRRTARQTARLIIRSWTLMLAVFDAGMVVNIAKSIYPVLDPYLFRFEEGLGIRLVTSLHRLWSATPGAHETLEFVYLSIVGVIGSHEAFDAKDSSPLPFLFVISSVIGIGFYCLYPAIGPEIATPGYDQSIWGAPSNVPIAQIPRDQTLGAVRNCMPSLHAVWGYFLMWNNRNIVKGLRGIFVALGALTPFASLESGNHWFIDIVVALPFAVAIQALCNLDRPVFDRGRILCVASGFAMVVFWIIALRLDWFVIETPGWLRWSIIAATIAGSVPLIRLSKSEPRLKQWRQSTLS